MILAQWHSRSLIHLHRLSHKLILLLTNTPYPLSHILHTPYFLSLTRSDCHVLIHTFTSSLSLSRSPSLTFTLSRSPTLSLTIAHSLTLSLFRSRWQCYNNLPRIRQYDIWWICISYQQLKMALAVNGFYSFMDLIYQFHLREHVNLL